MSYDRKDKQPVNWLREHTTANGTVMRISDRSGIVQFNLGGNPIQAYRDEFVQMFHDALEIMKYLEDNQDVAFGREESRQSRMIKRGQEKEQRKVASKDIDALSRVVEAKANVTIKLLDSGKTLEEIPAILKVMGF